MDESLSDRLARYQAEVQQFQDKWGVTLEEMAARYHAVGVENPEVDDDYLQWRWYAEAVASIQSQLTGPGSGQKVAALP